jgi:hypothetical protein
MPTMMLPMSPNPTPLTMMPASQPAIAPDDEDDQCLQ